MNKQEELFYKIKSISNRINHLAAYVQNDFNLGHHNSDSLKDDIINMNTEYDDCIEHLNKLKLEANEIIKNYIYE